MNNDEATKDQIGLSDWQQFLASVTREALERKRREQARVVQECLKQVLTACLTQARKGEEHALIKLDLDVSADVLRALRGKNLVCQQEEPATLRKEAVASATFRVTWAGEVEAQGP